MRRSDADKLSYLISVAAIVISLVGLGSLVFAAAQTAPQSTLTTVCRDLDVDPGFACTPETTVRSPAYVVTSNIADGATLSQTTTWTAFTSGGATSAVDFYVDGVRLWTEHSPLYQFDGDPDGVLTLTAGAHVLTLVATAPAILATLVIHVTVS